MYYLLVCYLLKETCQNPKPMILIIESRDVRSVMKLQNTKQNFKLRLYKIHYIVKKIIFI